MSKLSSDELVSSEGSDVVTPTSSSTARTSSVTSSTAGIETVGSTAIAGRNTPSAGINMPSAGINMPSTGLNMPGSGINTPSAGINLPAAGRNMISVGINIQSAGINMPSAGISTPATGIEPSVAGTSTSDAGISTPVAGIDTPDATVLAARRIWAKDDQPQALRENLSKAKPEPAKKRSQDYIFKTNVRKASEQNGELQMLDNIRENRYSLGSKSISFNSTVHTIDAIFRVYNSMTQQSLPEMVEAVKKSDISTIRRLMDNKTCEPRDILFKCIDQNNSDLLDQVIQSTEITDINSIHKIDSDETLLHFAAFTGSIKCCEVLLKHGANVNSWDLKQKLSPLHCAMAVKDQHLGRKVMELLVNNNADINSGLSIDGGSVLHIAVKNQNYLGVKYLLEQKVDTVPPGVSETALHVAAENNNLEIGRLLLDENPRLVNTLKGEKTKLTALHLAAEAGYSEMCAMLLAYKADMRLKSPTEGTPLHLAAKSRSENVIRLLLQQGTEKDLNEKDHKGQTPLMLATCSVHKGESGSTNCMKLLLENNADVNQQNDGGDSALHLAAKDCKPKRVDLLIKYGADLCLQNNAGFSAFYFINKKVPQCMQSLASRMDSGMRLSGENDTIVKLDFTKLSPTINNYQPQDTKLFMELSQSHHSILLKHPLSEAYLFLKWNQVKYLYMGLIVFTHAVFSSVYSMYILLLYANLCRPDHDKPEDRHQLLNPIECGTQRSDKTEGMFIVTFISWILLIIFLMFYVFKEILKFWASPRNYFVQLESFHDLFIIITTISVISVDLRVGMNEGSIIIYRWQYHAACFGCFSTWLYMMFLIARVPRFGKYVEMFKTVTISMLNFMGAYISLLLAFATTFMVAFPKIDAFHNIFPAFVKLIVMMLGEIEYEDLYYSKENIIINQTEIRETLELPVFPVTAHLFVFLFVFGVSIILMNLLVGLAVSDIQGLSKSAKLHQLLQQVQLINYMEKFLTSPYFCALPEYIKEFLRDKLQGLHTKFDKVYTIKPNDINDKQLPETLKKSIHENCKRRKMDITEDINRKEMKKMKEDIELILGLLTGGKSIQQSKYKMEKQNYSMRSIDTLDVESDFDSDVEIGTFSPMVGRRLMSAPILGSAAQNPIVDQLMKNITRQKNTRILSAQSSTDESDTSNTLEADYETDFKKKYDNTDP